MAVPGIVYRNGKYQVVDWTNSFSALGSVPSRPGVQGAGTYGAKGASQPTNTTTCVVWALSPPGARQPTLSLNKSADVAKEKSKPSPLGNSNKPTLLLPKYAKDHAWNVNKETSQPTVAAPGRENVAPKAAAVGKPTLVLDLDETLVHASTWPVPGYDFTVAAGPNLKYYVKVRPHVGRFLARVAELFNVVVFTASKSGYAEKVVQYLDPKGKIFSKVLHRRSCTVLGRGQFSKDLSQLGVDLSRVCLVDNQLLSFLHQPYNGVPIRSFMGEARDHELPQLLPFLEKLASERDLRSYIARKFPATARMVLGQACRFPNVNFNQGSRV